MPTYDYKCKACGESMEIFQSIKESPKRKCPKCGKSALERLIGTGGAIIFKGSGFYLTDYRSESYRKAAEADKPQSDSKSDAKPDTKSETKPETKAEAKPDAKPESKTGSKADSKSESKGSDSKRDSVPKSESKPVAKASAARSDSRKRGGRSKSKP
jgi:putative FmdB family regulatory protein